MTINALREMADAKRCPLLVVKVGSSLLVAPDGSPRKAWLTMLAQDLAEMQRGGQKIIIVSSGAIALGAARLDMDRSGRGNLADAQAAAAVGQIALAGLWADSLGAYGITSAQILLTLADLEDRRRYLNASATLERLLAAGAIPVINENDSVATEEIRFGDNDRLAARVAQAARADGVMLLSDVDGLYDGTPGEEGSHLVEIVPEVTAGVRAMVRSGSGSGMGSGGMSSKLDAAEIAQRAGITLAIVNGTHESPIANAIASGRGTLFPATDDGGTARKAWIGGRMAMAGTLVVDSGCASALADGASVLAAGLVSVDGDFARGDAVAIHSADGRALAQGLSEYSSAECVAVKGIRSGDQASILGYAPRAAVVHRNHLVLL